MSIHREGRKILFILLLVLAGVNLAFMQYYSSELFSNILIGVSVVFYLLVLQFFRNPTVETTPDDSVVYAPADGKVVVIEQTSEDEYFNDERIQVSIFMSPLNVHVNRSPIAGVVKYFKYHPGKYLVAWHPKSSTENERTTMVVERPNVTLLVRQVAGAVARRIKWYVSEGQNVTQGGEYGFIKFGSRLDIYLPLDAEIVCEKEQVTKGGKTVIARIKSA